MLDLDENSEAEYFIPLIWQGDSPGISPGYNPRGSMYGLNGIPHSQWNGYEQIIGGNTSTMYPYYLDLYNQLVEEDSPLELTVGLGVDEVGNLEINADVLLTENITTANNKIVYIIKWHQDNDYFCSVVQYDYEDFYLTTIGETGSFSHCFTWNEVWEVQDIQAVVLIQTYNSDYRILQAAQSEFNGLLSIISSNVQTGPPSLAVNFTSSSYPANGIQTWEWDVDGDGVYDYTAENPTHVYDTPGSYNVTLRVGMNGEFNEVTMPGYVTVTEDAIAEGSVSGCWHSELSPYLATGDLLVDQGSVLEIEPGTVIILENGAELLIKGQLIADARDSEMIVFRTESDWAGVHIMDSSEENIIAWCEITGATESAIYLDNSVCDIINNLIHHNSSSALGAAIELLDVADILISGNLIANNTSSGMTAGICMTNSYPFVNNNIVVNNTSANAGAFSIKQNSAPVLSNNTIAGNSAVNGTFFLFNSQLSLNNCIVCTSGDVFYNIASSATVMYSCLPGGYTGEGNIDADPMFINPSEGDGSEFDGMTANWQFLAGSPCIDAGNPDLDYNDLDESRNDMGAFGWYGFPDYGLTDTDPENIVPVKLDIKAYPNPFNPSTNLSFNLSEAENGSLEVYNIKGQLIETLADRHFDAGNHQIIWNAEKFASGVYFVMFNNGSGKFFQKIVLMK